MTELLGDPDEHDYEEEESMTTPHPEDMPDPVKRERTACGFQFGPLGELP